MAGGGGVENDEAGATLGDLFGEGAEDGDFFGAGGAEILFEEGLALGVEAGLADDFFGVFADLFDWVYAGDGEAGDCVANGGGDVGGGVRCCEVDLVAAGGEGDGEGRGDGGFAYAAFAHGEDDAVALGFEFVEEG